VILLRLLGCIGITELKTESNRQWVDGAGSCRNFYQEKDI